MKATLFSVFSFLILSFCVGCSTNAVSNDTKNSGPFTVTIAFDFEENQATDDGLEDMQRKILSNYLTNTVKEMKILVTQNSLSYWLDFSVDVENEVCEKISLELEEGVCDLSIYAKNHKGITYFRGKKQLTANGDVSTEVCLKQCKVLTGNLVIKNPAGDYVEGKEYTLKPIKNLVYGAFTEGFFYKHGSLVSHEVNFWKIATDDFTFSIKDVENSEMKARFHILNYMSSESIEVTPK